ncbi:hypothetical protein HYQ40_08335 [Aerococcaceae bacterium DSM 111021]|nr:hypothetical protein [Aerococcaceae bacterium DSM 111021]
MEKNIDLLKHAVIFAHIANYIILFVAAFNAPNMMSFFPESFMFFTSNCITSYSLTPKTKEGKKSRYILVKGTFWGSAISFILLLLNQIDIAIVKNSILLLLKVWTIFSGAYYTFLLYKVDREVSNSDKKQSSEITDFIRNMDKKSDSPLKDNNINRKKMSKFVKKKSRK